MVQWQTRAMTDPSERLVEQVSSSAHSQCKSATASHHSFLEAGVENLFAAALTAGATFSACRFASSIAALAIGFMLSNCFAIVPKNTLGSFAGGNCTQNNTRVDRIRVKKL